MSLKIRFTNGLTLLKFDDDRQNIEREVDELTKAVKNLKKEKSPGRDGILSDCFQIYRDLIKTDFTEVIKEVFDKK